MLLIGLVGLGFLALCTYKFAPAAWVYAKIITSLLMLGIATLIFIFSIWAYFNRQPFYVVGVSLVIAAIFAIPYIIISDKWYEKED